FACTYCYARYTHEFLGFERWEEFEKRIFVKTKGVEALLGQLKPGKFKGQGIAIGTATDPYQPAEARYRLTRRLLEVFSKFRGLDLSITTKSSLVTRDLDLLQELSERSALSVRITITTLNSDLARILEPHAPDPPARLRTLSRLREAGIRAGVNAMPILPGITDSPADLDSVFSAAKEAGAQFIGSSVLFLSSDPTRARYLKFLREHFPHLAKQYQNYTRASSRYTTEIQSLCERLRAKYQLHTREESDQFLEPAQLDLFG
ncbi:MAG TPA: radical SAM protein, partial [Acidobacteriota bacterium]|nr:radical SAM protein [Acidobacteriota bacterium]